MTGMPILSAPLPVTVADCDARLAELRSARAALIDPTSRELAMLEVDRVLDRRTALAARGRPNPFDSRRQAA